MSVRILVGHCREKLREMPPASVHCVVTNPPCWGLRDYGIAPLVWGGEAAGVAAVLTREFLLLGGVGARGGLGAQRLGDAL